MILADDVERRMWVSWTTDRRRTFHGTIVFWVRVGSGRFIRVVLSPANRRGEKENIILSLDRTKRIWSLTFNIFVNAYWSFGPGAGKWRYKLAILLEPALIHIAVHVGENAGLEGTLYNIALLVLGGLEIVSYTWASYTSCLRNLLKISRIDRQRMLYKARDFNILISGQEQIVAEIGSDGLRI